MNVLRALRLYREPFLVLLTTLLSLLVWQRWSAQASPLIGPDPRDEALAPEALEALIAEDAARDAEAPVAPSLTVSAAAAAATQAPAVKQRILLLGDSMVEVLAPRLADYALENGHELVPAIWYGSTTSAWAKSAELGALLREVNPSLVVVVLGSSELTRREPERRRPFVEAIVRRIGARDLVWIGPPNWRQDTGINAVLESVLGTDRFFRSAELALPRKKDGIHPDVEGGRTWANTFVDWLAQDSRYELRMSRPSHEAPAVPARVLGRM